jgi:hypothetical protein
VRPRAGGHAPLPLDDDVSRPAWLVEEATVAGILRADEGATDRLEGWRGLEGEQRGWKGWELVGRQGFCFLAFGSDCEGNFIISTGSSSQDGRRPALWPANLG